LINSAGTESKYGLKIDIPNSTGIIGSINGESIFAETKIRLEVINVGPTFVMDVEGQVKNSPNWYVITTVTGAITGTLDISTYDRVRYNVITADGIGTLLSSGFILSATPFTFAPTGELYVSLSNSVKYTTLVDTTNPSIIYIGEARFGTLEGEASWLITKNDLTTGIISIKTSGTLYDSIWNDRASLIYG
jgi:hypothetical protein